MEQLSDKIIEFLENENFPFECLPDEQKSFLKRLARKYHPDKLGKKSDLVSEEKIRYTTTAIDFLTKRGSISYYKREKNNGSTSQHSSTTGKKTKKDFVKDFTQNYWKFKRDDGSFFELKANSKTESSNVYSYNFKDEAIHGGKEQLLVTEISPEEIFEIMSNPQMLDYFKNNYLGSERAKKIFSIRQPNSFRYSDNDYIGNGYGGYIKKSEYNESRYYNKSRKKLLEACYEISKKNFDKDFRQNFWKFKRDDGSFFELKANSKTESTNMYSYYFKDGSIHGGKEQLLVTEMSPEEIFDIISNPQMLDYFKNNYLGGKRAKKIFEIKNPNSFNRYLENDYIGNGYGGYIKEKFVYRGNADYDNRSSLRILEACYEISKKNFDKDFRQNFWKFKRDDGSFFELKANSKTESTNMYSYYFKDGSIHGGKEQLLVTEMSPEEIFDIISNPQMLDYFKNNYLGGKRAKKIFEIKNPNSFNRYLENDYIGNGYGGYIKEKFVYRGNADYDNRSSLRILEACYEIGRRKKDTTFGDDSDAPRRD